MNAIQHAQIPALGSISIRDRSLVRDLARQVREIAELPIIAERRRAWYEHNACRSPHPMVLAYPDCAWDECVQPEECVCKNEIVRGWELELRHKIFWHERINDDNVLNPFFDIPWDIHLDNFGVDIKYTRGDNRGSFVWEPPIKDIQRDLAKLHFRAINVDRERTMAVVALARELFGDVLPVRIHDTGYCWSHGLTYDAVQLVGLEQFMVAVYDDPAGVHALMSFLRDERMHYLSFLEEERLLSDNNEALHIGTGGVACTRELPRRKTISDPVRLVDLWGYAESQDTIGISPEMFGEFVWPYQKPLLDRFGLKCYGCCEPIDKRLKFIINEKDMRRIAISPWSDQELCAEAMGNRFVFVRKQNPAMICVQFNEDQIRADLQKTLAIAGKCNLEIIQRDTHTFQHEPWRVTRWVEIAREEVGKYMRD